jgi:hypothetical protein
VSSTIEKVEFEFELRQNLLGIQPAVLAYRPQTCPQCGHDFEDGQIDYLANDGGHLLMVSDLPILRCRGKGHLFMLEETFDRLERLISLERRNKTKPVSSLTIPVYEFAVE